jgi:hypothetical protein
MQNYMLRIGGRANLGPDEALDFANKATEHFLPLPGSAREPIRPEQTVIHGSQTIAAYDGEMNMLGFVAYGDGVKSSWPRFQRLNRAVKMYRIGKNASFDRPRIVYKMAFLKDAQVERHLLSRAMRGAEPGQQVYVETVGQDDALTDILESGNIYPSDTSEATAFFPEHPEVLVTRHFGRSLLHSAGLMAAASPANDTST